MRIHVVENNVNSPGRGLATLRQSLDEACAKACPFRHSPRLAEPVSRDSSARHPFWVSGLRAAPRLSALRCLASLACRGAWLAARLFYCLSKRAARPLRAGKFALRNHNPQCSARL